MRIAITVDPEIPVPPVQYGGVERIADDLVQGLVGRGHQVTLFAHPASTVTCDLRPYPGAASQSKIDTLPAIWPMSLVRFSERGTMWCTASGAWRIFSLYCRSGFRSS
jgi:hypothetical protein